ncbi:MAG: hypothetical protein ACK55X_08845 [Synechococcaceae cyanobacterium]
MAGLASLGLGATPAHALSTPCSFGTNVDAPACQLNVPYDSDLPSDKQITLLQGPTVGNGTIDFDWIPLPPPGYVSDLWEVDVDFDEDLVGPAGGTSGVFDYKIDIFNTPFQFFKTVELSVESAVGNPSVTKSIYSDDAFTNLISQITVTGDGRSGFLPLPSTLQTLWVRDFYSVPEGAVLGSFKNIYTQVPGPLPLLGAGTAFGFSRRLRRRVRQRHSLG